MKILVTGATGFVGQALCRHLGGEDQLIALARDPQNADRRLGGTAEARPLPTTSSEWAAAVEGCNAVVNLAGESIASGRWTEDRKKRILDSRVDLTRALVSGIAAATKKPRVLVSASAVGYYGPRGDEELDEAAPAGDDFLARVCLAWEREAAAAESSGVRTVRLRTGVVLGDDGGALARMVTPFKLFAGGPLGSGTQWMSWVHRDDLIGLIDLCLRDTRASGAVNATAPAPRTMREFCRTLGEVLGRPSWAPVPAFVLRLALGEMSDMLLTGQRVLPRAALRLGYQFRHPDLKGALRASLEPRG